jgi:hypothetical protein
VGRASADAGCPTSTPEETAAGWTQWAGSWQGWMNGETGGYVCQREITWAKDSPPYRVAANPLVAGCQQIGSGSNYGQFGISVALPWTAPVYGDANCTTVKPGHWGWDFVYSPSSDPELARPLCIENFGDASLLAQLTEDVWGCHPIY